MKKKKKNKIKSIPEKIRREKEIETYGKLVSLRPSIEHKSKKLYSRKKKNKDEVTWDFSE